VKLPPKRGKTVVEIMDAVHADEIKGMYIEGENPAMSDPDLNHAREALAHLEHLVVQDLFLTETAVYADVILPASAWPEKDGTVTNTNRQVQMGRQALPLPGDTRHDLWIIQEIANRMGCGWTYKHVSEVYTEMASMMPALDNISWERVEREHAVTYPSDGRTFRAATWCSTRVTRGRAASPSWLPPSSRRRTRCRTRSIRSSCRPAVSSSIGTPAR
jgi:formate dehydrogenase major subunit